MIPSASASASASKSIASKSGQLTPRDELDSILSAFPAGIDFALGYGSGVFHQQNHHNHHSHDPLHSPSSASSSSSLYSNNDDRKDTVDDPSSTTDNSSSSATPPKPMIDLILVTSDPKAWHTQNLRAHPDHYASLPRLLGVDFITALQEWGAGLYFHPMVSMPASSGGEAQEGEDEPRVVKYGVISRERLKADLLHWETLYCAGRMHKPIVPLSTSASAGQPSPSSSPHHRPPPLVYGDDEISEWQRSNLRSALATSLLLQPPVASSSPSSHRSQRQHQLKLASLFQTIAGLSYTGDPRMTAGSAAEDPHKVSKLVHSPGQLDRFLRLYRDELLDLHQLGLISYHDDGGGDNGAAVVAGGGAGVVVDVDLNDVVTRTALYDRLPTTLCHHTNTNNITNAYLQKHPQSLPTKFIHQEIQSLTNGLRKVVGPPARLQGIKGVVTAGVWKSAIYLGQKISKGSLFTKKKDGRGG